MNVPTGLLKFLIISSATMVAAITSAAAQTTTLKPDFLMVLYATQTVPTVVNPNYRINTVTGGSVEGPRIKGKIIAPMGDWLRTVAPGVNRLDVRLTIQTDDDQIIYVSYNGIAQCPKESVDKLMSGEQLKAEDCYLITAPTFETSSEKYSWLNAVQAVGKMVELKRGSHIKYEIFTMK
jgi:hypothetical protein